MTKVNLTVCSSDKDEERMARFWKSDINGRKCERYYPSLLYNTVKSHHHWKWVRLRTSETNLVRPAI
jgi:hypothetical protein